MSDRKPVVLIGPVCDDPAESVSAVNRALVAGLSDRYTFVTSATNRRFGGTSQARFNAWNIYYLLKHVATWTWNLLRYRPAIAHYAINGGWALWKGLLFLRLARTLGIRTVGHLHSGGFLDFWETLSNEKRAKALDQFAQLDAFIVLSDTWETAMRDKIGVAAEKLYVVNNPIDGQFEDAALQFPVARHAPAILAMGVMGRDKGVLDLVTAVADVQRRGTEFKLHLIGPEREPGIFDRVRQQLAESNLGPQVTMPGPVRGAEKLRLFRDTTISVLPSYYENFPLVLLEAAAAGHAIITTPVGAVPEFFRDGESAAFVDIGHPRQLADAIDRLLSNPDERRRLAEGARQVFISRLARPAIMASLERVYTAVRGDRVMNLQLKAENADA